MSVFDQARVLIYRINKKGLEVFLQMDKSDSENKYKVPDALLKYKKAKLIDQDFIALDPISIDGDEQSICAVEADWHEIPSVKAIIKQDIKIVKDIVKHTIYELDDCVFVNMKEAAKKVMPQEYAALKELKDILLEKNQSKYI